MNAFDVVFVLAALAFNLLIGGIFVAQKLSHIRLRRALGLLWLSLALPFGVVFLAYLNAGRDRWILVGLGFVLVFMAAEWLLDYRLKLPFRERLSSHVLYIVMEYVALFSLIGIAFAIHPVAGWAVSVSFWLLMGALVYLYAGRSKGRQGHPPAG